MTDPIRTHPEIAVQGISQRRPGWMDFMASSDHKDVGRIYIGAALSFLALAAVEFFLMRMQLMVPDNTLIEPITFNRLLSVFGVSITVLFVLPLAMGLITYLMPLQIGSRATAFPRLGTLALWLYLAGGAITYISFFYTPPETGTIALPPLSGDLAFVDNNGTDVWIAAVGLSTLGFVLQSINLVITASRERAPGMAWRRFPIFSFSGLVSSWILLVVGPAMLAALVMLEIDRHFDGVFFDPAGGGSPVYFQHLSSIFSTGVYLICLITAIGIISEIVQTFSGRSLPHRRAVARSIVAIAVLGTLAWMQNMMSGNLRDGFLFAAMAFAVALLVPVGIVFWNWFGCLASIKSPFRAALLWAAGAISLLSLGLAGELMQSLIPVNWLLASTTDSTAETGLVLVGGSVMAGFAALHYWLPKMSGREIGEGIGKVSAILIYASAIVTFACLYLAGVDGQPADTFRFFAGQGLDTYNLIASISSIFLMIGIFIAIANCIHGVSRGRQVGHDPWGGSTLEWFALSPPPPHNFDLVPDVRSAEPMDDIRRSLGPRTPAQAADSDQPVA